MRKLIALSLIAIVLGMAGCIPPEPEDTSGMYLNVDWIVARGVPSASDGVDGDLYLDTESTILYVKTDGAWVNVGALRGTDGAGWLFGAGVPSASLGDDGDLYLDTASTVAYKKAGGAWSVLFALEGETGAAGEAGADGATWLTGSGDPNVSDPAAAEGDLYLDTGSTMVYVKTSTGWDVVMSFRAAVATQYAFTPNTSMWGTTLYGAAYGEVEGVGLWVSVGSTGTVVTSTDGTEWTLTQQAPSRIARGIVAPQDPGTGISVNLYSVAYGQVGGDGLFVAVGDYLFDAGYYYPGIYTSADGASWSLADLEEMNQPRLYGVCYVNGRFVALGEVATEGYVPFLMWSIDGLDWTAVEVSGGGPSAACAYGEGTYVVVEWDGTILVSRDDLATLSSDSVTLPGFVTPYLFSVAWHDGTFVAVGYDGSTFTPLVLVSDDGDAWSTQDLPLSQACYLYGITAGNAGFVASGYSYSLDAYNSLETESAVVLSSPDGISWSADRWDYALGNVAWGDMNGGRYVVVRGIAVPDTVGGYRYSSGGIE